MPTSVDWYIFILCHKLHKLVKPRGGGESGGGAWPPLPRPLKLLLAIALYPPPKYATEHNSLIDFWTANYKNKILTFQDLGRGLFLALHQNILSTYQLVSPYDTRPTVRVGARAVDLEGPKFEIKHKSHCFQKSKLVDWGSQVPRARPIVFS